MQATKWAAVVSLISMALAARANATDILINGGFENPDDTFVNQGGGYDNLPVGSTDITGWTVTGNIISWAQVPNADNIGSDEGSYFLDLTGPGPGNPAVPGGITQTINTAVGTTYSVSIALLTIDSTPSSAEVDAGTTSQTFTTTDENTWDTFSFDFTATSEQTPISITEVSADNLLGVDAASVDVVPEPSALGALALAATASLRLRRR